LKKIFLSLLLYCSFLNCFAQHITDTAFADLSSINNAFESESKTLIFIDSSSARIDETNIADQKFIPLTYFPQKDNIPNRLVTKTFWLRFSFRNSRDSFHTFRFFAGYGFDKMVLYKINSKHNLSPVFSDAESGFTKFSLYPGETATYFLKLKMFKLKFNKISAVFLDKKTINQFKTELDAPFNDKNNGMKLMSGMLLLMVMFTLVNFVITGRAEFFYNFLYSLFMFILIFFYAYLTRSSGWFRGFFYSWFDLVLLIVGTICYIEFVIIFLRTTINDKWLNKFLRFEKYTLWVMIVLYSYLHFFTNTFNPQEQLENLMKIFILIAGIIYIVAALKQRNKLVNYIAVGTIFQIACSIVSLILLQVSRDQTNLFTSAGFYFSVSIIASVIFYLMGLTYKNRMELIEKLNERQTMKTEMEKKEFDKQIELIKARQNERNRISADMHDDLGAGMTTIRLYSELALNKMGENKIPEIEKISSSANDLLNKMNAIIWSMTSSNDTFSNMVAYIRSYAISYCEDNKLNCKMILPDVLPDIVVSGEIRRNIFLVVKEALHNIVKHSGADQITLELSETNKILKLTIHDNGKGIELTKIKEFGNGLRNMKKRMQDLGITFLIENKGGTLITMTYDQNQALSVG
jgi:signal transduction histidine kinase